MLPCGLPAGGPCGRCWKSTPRRWRSFRGCNHCWLTAGLVVNLTSDAAVGGYPGWGGYGASKAALELICGRWPPELGDAGIYVIVVDPGDMRTQMHQDAFAGEDISDRPPPEITLPFWGWLLGRSRGRSPAGGSRPKLSGWETA